MVALGSVEHLDCVMAGIRCLKKGTRSVPSLNDDILRYPASLLTNSMIYWCASLKEMPKKLGCRVCHLLLMPDLKTSYTTLL